MAKGLNKVLLIGRLGADPEIRYTASGSAVANLRIATDSPIKRGDQWETETEWHRVVVWNRQAEFCGEFLSKGSLVFIEGRIRTRAWEDRDGNKRWTTEIVARDIQSLSGKGADRPDGAGDSDPVPPEPPIEDDVPF